MTPAESVRQANPPRIAVVGCGAIARGYHLPGLVRHPELVPHLILVDASADRAAALAKEFGISRTATKYSEILGDVDGVIVTVPHNLHYSITMECLAAGKHVLCEKPLAESYAEAREMVTAAERAGVSLAANHVLRLYPLTRRIGELVHDGALGKLTRIRFDWGEKFDWPAASRFYFGGVGAVPRGVLFDKGPHVLDLICWWLGAKPEVVSVRDDSSGGGEAVTIVHLKHGDCSIEVELSFLSRYENNYSIEGDAGRIDSPIYEFQKYLFTPRGEPSRTVKLSDSPVKNLDDFSGVMIDNFIAVVRGVGKPIVSAASVLDSVALIDECYAKRERFDMPWHDAGLEVLHV